MSEHPNFSIGESESDPELNRAAMDFYEAVVKSGKYSWMGLFETTDELERQRLVVYLHERRVQPTPQLNESVDNKIDQAFEELYFALPPQAILDLYFNCTVSDTRDQIVESCMHDVGSRYGTREMPASVAHRWDQEFS